MCSISSVSSSAATFQALQAAASADKSPLKTPATSAPLTQAVKTNDGDGDGTGGGINITA